MKDTIVIPDLHGRSFWKEAVDKCLHSEEKGSWGERRKPHDDVWNTLGRASKLRGGIDECGSPVWADVKEVESECEMYRDADYFVFGHTQLDVPIITDTYACLDTRQAYKISSSGEIEAITQKHNPDISKEIDFSRF